MNNTIADESEYACSGCGACAAICNCAAISLKMGETGFFNAEVDETLCIHCGKCKRVCSRFIKNADGKSLYDAKVYALKSSDKNVLKNSASGGIAHELACMGLGDQTKVSGVVYDCEQNIAKHIIIGNGRDLSRIDGSKYLQSLTAPAFREIIEETTKDKKNRYIVFGLPCQIFGLRRVAKTIHINEQLLLIELFCHGVPSYRIWDKELDRIETKIKTRHFRKVTFRDKTVDWHNYCLNVEAEQKIFRGKRENDLFWQAYFEDILLGDSCYRCRFRKDISSADIRIGDYWGSKYQSDTEGVSAVFACTDKGEQAIKELIADSKVHVLEATSAEEMLSMQNLPGYHGEEKVHREAMEQLQSGTDVLYVIDNYRKNETVKRKIKRAVLIASSVLPDGIRVNLKKSVSRVLMR